MFKFIDSSGNDVWLRPSCIEFVEHVKGGTEHTVRIGNSANVFFYEPTSEEDCRSFLFNLFKAMGETYRYE